jgi:ABC-2 type transport system ATP-binding protein
MVQIESLTFGYRRGYPLFDDLNMTLRKGCVYGLFGVNGAGKTTLIRQIAGLLFPKQGNVRIDGRESGRRDVEMMRDLYIIPEEFRLPPVSVNNYLKVHTGFYPDFDRAVFDRIVQEFEIDQGQKLENFSYGQKKKFLIAFGIATNCGLLLMDEPTNGLDIPSKSQFRKIMASHVNENRCVLISTHQVRDLASIIDHVIILDGGRIRFMQSTEAITDNLSFGLQTAISENEVLYSEDVFGGKAAITKNHGKHTEIDFELLFNGVIKNGEILNNAIQGGQHEN